MFVSLVADMFMLQFNSMVCSVCRAHGYQVNHSVEGLITQGGGATSPTMNANKLQGSQTYKLAMHNFLAETVDFFVKDDLTGFVSRPEEQFEPMKEGETYTMRVNINKNERNN